LDHQRFRFSENFVADRNFLPVIHLTKFLLCHRQTRFQGGDVVNFFRMMGGVDVPVEIVDVK
jgi:hypothetical protein